MGETSVTWVRDRQFVGIDSKQHAIVVSSQDSENSVGMKPSDLLPISLATCSAVDIVGILEKKRQVLDSMRITIQSEQDADPPWKFQSIHLHYEFSGDLDEQAIAKAIELSEGKYCSVAATLRPTVAISSTFDIIEGEDRK